MKLRHPLAIRAAACLLAFALRLWLLTTRVRMASVDGRAHPADASRERFLYVFWHEGLLAMISRRASVQVLISRHADGELIAQTCRRLGYGTIRGSSTRGGDQAMFEMIREADAEAHLIITPDGPRGPRRRLKAGPSLVASQARLRIVPIGVAFTAAWRARSWDRFAVPKPFSTLVGVVGEPITVPTDVDRRSLEQHVLAIQSRLDELTTAAEDWAYRLTQDASAAAPDLQSAAAESRPAA